MQSGSGGALFFKFIDLLRITGCKFLANKARSGGALGWYSLASVAVDSCHFSENEAVSALCSLVDYGKCVC